MFLSWRKTKNESKTKQKTLKGCKATLGGDKYICQLNSGGYIVGLRIRPNSANCAR